MAANHSHHVPQRKNIHNSVSINVRLTAVFIVLLWEKISVFLALTDSDFIS